MKLPLTIPFVLASLPLGAAEPPPFAPAPLELAPAFVASGLRLDLPIGPVRTDYSIPVRSGAAPATGKDWVMDAPGPGYRAQRARLDRK